MSTAYLGLGSNLGDRLSHLAGAVQALNHELRVRVEKASSVYETKPVGVTEQPDFLNLVVEVKTSLSARDLLACCLAIESDLGRVRTKRWGARTIDIDVLWFDGQVINEADLVVPHPRLLKRAFVLVPLAELAPALMVEGSRIDMQAALLDQSGLRRLGPLESSLR